MTAPSPPDSPGRTVAPSPAVLPPDHAPALAEQLLRLYTDVTRYEEHYYRTLRPRALERHARMQGEARHDPMLAPLPCLGIQRCRGQPCTERGVLAMRVSERHLPWA